VIAGGGWDSSLGAGLGPDTPRPLCLQTQGRLSHPDLRSPRRLEGGACLPCLMAVRSSSALALRSSRSRKVPGPILRTSPSITAASSDPSRTSANCRVGPKPRPLWEAWFSGAGSLSRVGDEPEQYLPLSCYALTMTGGTKHRRTCVSWPPVQPISAPASAFWRFTKSPRRAVPQRWQRAPIATHRP